MPAENFRNLAGKHFVFFGGTAGIGQAAAEKVAQEVFLRGDLSTLTGAKEAASQVQGWSTTIDGIVHSAMSAFNGKVITTDGLEFSFALQYQARVVLNNLLLDNLAASGDGRIVHLAGATPSFITPDLDDLHFERSSFSFYKAVLGTHNLAFMFIQEAGKRWKNRPVSIAAVCVGPTKTKAMTDNNMPFLMRLMGRFGTTPDISCKNIVHYLRLSSIPDDKRFGVMWDPKKGDIGLSTLPDDKAKKLWDITSSISAKHGLPMAAA